MAVPTRTLSTAEERREAVLAAAGKAFAARGYHGTPTTEIAKAAGISQAYLFRLFPTKRDLFVALIDRCYERTIETFANAADAAAGTDVSPLSAMANAYGELLSDRDVLLLMLQTHAATDDPEIREAVRRGFRRLYALVAERSGATGEELQAWFAHGMLMNVVAAMRADELDEPWAQVLSCLG